MRSIDINITQARLQSFSVNLTEKGTPDITATLGLYTSQGKKVSEYSISTYGWSDNKVQIPDEIHTHLVKVCEVLERVAHRECNGEMGILEGPRMNPTPSPKKKKEPQVIDIEDIPF